MYKYILLTLMLLVSGLSHAYEGKERVVWEKKPLSIALKIGEERIIHFPKNIEHWQPGVVDNSVVAQTVADTLYIKAITEFPTVRFRVREIGSNKVYLLDVSGKQDVEVPDTLVVIDEEQLRGESDRQAKQMATIGQDWRVRLTRYASQTLYAPERVVKADYSISRVSLTPGVEIPLIRGGKVKAQTVATWRGGGWYLHAIKLTNVTDEKVVLDPRIAYRGEWSTATPQHDWLGPSNSDQAVTTVYLTSKRTLIESLGLKE